MAHLCVRCRYILVYPQGCDVCNHLSLFLCVADYEKLLPGWNHFAQFTIAVVNSDPKKSKYSGAPGGLACVPCCPLRSNASAVRLPRSPCSCPTLCFRAIGTANGSCVAGTAILLRSGQPE